MHLPRHRSRSFSADRLEDILESDLSDLDLDLPALETFVGFPDLLDFGGPDCVSLRADSIELENDVLPSTPLTEEQFAQGEVDLGVPINQVSLKKLRLGGRVKEMSRDQILSPTRLPRVCLVF